MAKDEETGTDAAKRINAKACKALLKDLRSGQDDIDEVKGSMGGKVNAAIEKYNLNKKMFGWIRQFDRMTPERLADNYDDFLHLMDVSGLAERAKQAQRLALEEAPKDDEGGADKSEKSGGGSGKVHSFPQHRQAAAPPKE
jgi:hypothetical protein